MRTSMIGAAVAASVAFAVPAAAQSLDGPLAAPDAAASAPHLVKGRPKKTRHAAAKPAPGAPHAVPTDAPVPSGAAPASPVDLGMKWNGNNDSAAQTRSQNLDGNAFGSGAEVGMKLHF